MSRKLGSFVAITAVYLLWLTACRNKVNDSAIVSDIQAKLLQNQVLNDYYVHVESRGGAVTLSGTVSSATVKQAVDTLTRSTGRTTSFADKIAVVELPGTSPASSDPVIEAEVRAKFSANPILAKQTIEVSSNGGVLTLTGSVGSVAQKTQAVQLAEQTSGVRSLVDQLGVRSGVSPPGVFLKVSPQLITPGKSATLTWTSHNATSLDLEPGIGRVDSRGSRTVSPEKSTTYTLTAKGPAGQATASAQVNIWNAVPPTPQQPKPEPVLEPSAHLNAAPESITEGQSATLSWNTENANSVSIQPSVGAVPAHGSVTVSPKTPTTYFLNASGSGRSAIAKAKVNVLPAGPSQGTVVWEGEVHGTSSVSIEGSHASIGTIVSGGLPGVPCTVRLEKTSRAALQTSPAQWNGWKLIGLQVRGNGSVTVRISWSRLQ